MISVGMMKLFKVAFTEFFFPSFFIFSFLAKGQRDK